MRARQAERKLDRAVGRDLTPGTEDLASKVALRSAEKLTLMPILYRFLTGHDFSHADKANRTGWASAPAELILRFHSVPTPFSASCFVGPLPIKRELGFSPCYDSLVLVFPRLQRCA